MKDRWLTDNCYCRNVGRNCYSSVGKQSGRKFNKNVLLSVLDYMFTRTKSCK